MYASEKYVKMEVKALQGMITEVVNDLSGDIKFLGQEITELRNSMTLLREQLDEINRMRNNDL